MLAVYEKKTYNLCKYAYDSSDNITNYWMCRGK